MLGTSVPWLVVVLVLAALAGAIGLRLGARTRERTPGFPLQYAPPAGIGPAQAAYVLHEAVGREQYVASLLQASEAGALGLERHGERWTVRDRGGDDQWAGLDEVTRSTRSLLDGPGSSFTADPHDAGSGRLLGVATLDFEAAVRDWARTAGVLAPVRGIRLLRFVAVVAVVLTGVAVTANPLSMSATGLVPGFLLPGLLLALGPGSDTRRTATGRELWSRVGGFRRVLATPASEQRFDFSSRRELYTAYIPWAVALGCADQWAEKYRVETGSAPPVPAWLPVGAVSGGAAVSGLVADFDSTIGGAMSAYAATQRSSSSGGGGGGFSGGGGGGGGGGGSW